MLLITASSKGEKKRSRLLAGYGVASICRPYGSVAEYYAYSKGDELIEIQLVQAVRVILEMMKYDRLFL